MLNYLRHGPELFVPPESNSSRLSLRNEAGMGAVGAVGTLGRLGRLEWLGSVVGGEGLFKQHVW